MPDNSAFRMLPQTMTKRFHSPFWAKLFMVFAIILGFGCNGRGNKEMTTQGDTLRIRSQAPKVTGNWAGVIGTDTSRMAANVSLLGSSAEMNVKDLYFWSVDNRMRSLVDTLGSVEDCTSLHALLSILDSISDSIVRNRRNTAYWINHRFANWAGWRLPDGGHVLRSRLATLYLPSGSTKPFIVQAHPFYGSHNNLSFERNDRMSILAVYRVDEQMMPFAALKNPLRGALFESYHCISGTDDQHFLVIGTIAPELDELRFEALDSLFQIGIACNNAHVSTWAEEHLSGLCEEPMWTINDPGIAGALAFEYYEGCWGK